jgi:hypothetical protein
MVVRIEKGKSGPDKLIVNQFTCFVEQLRSAKERDFHGLRFQQLQYLAVIYG